MNKYGYINSTVASQQIPHYVRDDSPLCGGIGEYGGGKAATIFSLSFCDEPSFRRSEATEESASYKAEKKHEKH